MRETYDADLDKKPVCLTNKISDRLYYAHPPNQFWRLLGVVFGEPTLHELPHDARLMCVLSHGIDIWNVLNACHRQGSLDSAIRNAKPNDFDLLQEHAPLLKRVRFNDKTAGRFADVIGKAGYETLVLPSSSPANAVLSVEQKLVMWRGIGG